jgi:hypothetical protein
MGSGEGSSNWTAPLYNDAPGGQHDPVFGCFSDILSRDPACSPPSIDYDLDGCFADIPIASFEPLGESHYSDSGCFDDLDIHNPPSTPHNPFSVEELLRTSTYDPLLAGKLYLHPFEQVADCIVDSWLPAGYDFSLLKLTHVSYDVFASNLLASGMFLIVNC